MTVSQELIGNTQRTASSLGAIEHALVTAILLTGSAEMGEAALLHAIESAESFSGSGNELLSRTVVASLHMPEKAPISPDEHLLPAELLSVVRLPRLPRQCFVLSILLGVKRGECASALNLSEAEVGDLNGIAAGLLSRYLTNGNYGKQEPSVSACLRRYNATALSAV